MFGDDGRRQSWAFHRGTPGRVVRWHLSWLDVVEGAGESPLAAWAAEKRSSDEHAAE